MATSSVQGGIEGDEPDRVGFGKHWLETAWEQSPLPAEIWRRLLRVDRSLYAMGSIHALLLADAMGRADGGLGFEGIGVEDIEGLHLALTELGINAEVNLGEIRENRIDCAI